MLELADVMVELGAESAINLDGGGSTTLVHRGHLLNRPYSTQDQPAPASRRVVSALAFEPRSPTPGSRRARDEAQRRGAGGGEELEEERIWRRRRCWTRVRRCCKGPGALSSTISTIRMCSLVDAFPDGGIRARLPRGA